MTATENIWNNFHDELFNFIQKRIRNKEITNDILQDVFVKIHTKINSLKEEDKLKSWVYQITRNSVLDHFRKSKQIDSIEKDFPEEIESQTFNNELTKCLIPFVKQLSPDFEEAIRKTDLGKLSQKEFAEEIGISYSGAKSRVQRARQELKELFSDCCEINTDKYGNIIEHKVCKKNCGCI